MGLFKLDSPVKILNGVGKVRLEQLNKLGIETVKDLIYFFPRAYENRGDVRPLSRYDSEKNCAFILTVSSEVHQTKIKKNLTLSKFKAFDESGTVEIVFFNSPYVKDVFHVGTVFRFYGKIIGQKNKLQLTNPKYEPYIEGLPLQNLVPIYPQTTGLSSKQIDKLMSSVINDVLPEIIDPLPDFIRIENDLPTLTYALKNIHFPESDQAITKSQTRLAFDEMLYFGIGISLYSAKKNRGQGIKFAPCSLSPLTDTLPYELTNSQKQAINDIYRDTVIGNHGNVSPMARIIVGDVGCGKTVCAISAMYISSKSGYQSALMVPTEILARQHFEDVSSICKSLGIKVELLIGSTSMKEKKRIKASLLSGETDIVIGTHALISSDVEFKSLGLVITDEQHRFGVAQRAKLKDKSKSVHLLVMSATPIPRTLALTMYGDLDISKITEMPKGRERVETFVVNEEYRYRINDFIRKQVKLGGQCYIVCPSIQKNDEEDVFIKEFIDSELTNESSLGLKNVLDYSKNLSDSLPDIKIGVLHGKMKSQEKDEIMAGFSSGETNVLVSTTVVEVGVNVPNASLMIVENAERFGLSQLHQLRGRVGRGNRKSYCILVSDFSSSKIKARLDVMKTTYDGYEIAEKDLILRGPGDFFSSISGDNLRQSGGFEFKFASMCDNSNLLNSAFSTAKTIINSDPLLENPENLGIRNEVERYLSISLSTVS